MYDASSSEINTYIIWYVWTYIASISVVGTAVLYIGGNYKILASLLNCMSEPIALAVSLGILFNNIYTDQGASDTKSIDDSLWGHEVCNEAQEP